jgi:hypothetical protein
MLLTILGILGVIPVLVAIYNRFLPIVKKNVLNQGISCSILEHKIRGRVCNTKVKIAHVGVGKEIIDKVLFTYQMKLPAPLDRFLAYIHIGLAFISCDMNELSLLIGTKYNKAIPVNLHLWNVPKYIKYPISVIFGIYFLYGMLLMFICVIPGWFFLNWGPYGRFSLDSLNESMIIVDQNGNEKNFPIILGEEELTLDFKYKLGLNAKGFSIKTPFKFLTNLPHKSLLPPKPENFCWIGRGSINLMIAEHWSHLTTKLDNNKIISVGR